MQDVYQGQRAVQRSRARLNPSRGQVGARSNEQECHEAVLYTYCCDSYSGDIYLLMRELTDLLIMSALRVSPLSLLRIAPSTVSPIKKHLALQQFYSSYQSKCRPLLLLSFHEPPRQHQPPLLQRHHQALSSSSKANNNNNTANDHPLDRYGLCLLALQSCLLRKQSVASRGTTPS